VDLLRQFWIHVLDTDVKKGWDCIEVRGERISVPEGKYMQIDEIEPEKMWWIAFEDLTEEIGEIPNYDFDEPLLEVTLIKPGTLKVKGLWYTSFYRQSLYFKETALYEDFGAGEFEDFGEWTVTYPVPVPWWAALLGISSMILGAIVTGYAVKHRK